MRPEGISHTSLVLLESWTEYEREYILDDMNGTVYGIIIREDYVKKRVDISRNNELGNHISRQMRWNAQIQKVNDYV